MKVSSEEGKWWSEDTIPNKLTQKLTKILFSCGCCFFTYQTITNDDTIVDKKSNTASNHIQQMLENTNAKEWGKWPKKSGQNNRLRIVMGYSRMD